MVLVGMLDSPYVRRCAVSMKLMGVPFEHRPLSVFRTFEQFRAINAADKGVQVVYEKTQRPAHLRYHQWLDRIVGQANAAYAELEGTVAKARAWLQGGRISAADVVTACAWRFGQFYNPEEIPASRYPALVAFSRRAEVLPEFASTPLD